MLARVLTVQLKPDKVEEFERFIEGLLESVVKNQPGFKNGYLFLDRNSGKGIIASVWETQEAYQTWEKNSQFAERVGQLAPLFAAPPIVDLMDFISRP